MLYSSNSFLPYLLLFRVFLLLYSYIFVFSISVFPFYLFSFYFPLSIFLFSSSVSWFYLLMSFVLSLLLLLYDIISSSHFPHVSFLFLCFPSPFPLFILFPFSTYLPLCYTIFPSVAIICLV